MAATVGGAATVLLEGLQPYEGMAVTVGTAATLGPQGCHRTCPGTDRPALLLAFDMSERAWLPPPAVVSCESAARSGHTATLVHPTPDPALSLSLSFHSPTALAHMHMHMHMCRTCACIQAVATGLSSHGCGPATAQLHARLPSYGCR